MIQPMILNDETMTHLAAHHRNFEEFADQMIRSYPGRFDEIFWSFLSRNLGSPSSIVDFGTGPGLFLMDLVKRYPQAQIFGVEGQPSMIRRAHTLLRAQQPAPTLIEHDLASPPITPLADASMGAAVASMVLHEMPVPTLLIDEAARVLKPGGVWLIYDWIRQPLSKYFAGIRPETQDQFTHFSEHCRYTPEDWCWLLERSGFDIPEWMVRHSGMHVLIAAKKKG